MLLVIKSLLRQQEANVLSCDDTTQISHDYYIIAALKYQYFGALFLEELYYERRSLSV